MIISWFGQTCLKIQTDKTTVVTDPLTNASGLKAPRLTGDIVLLSTSDYSADEVKPATRPQPFVITTPGEYEVMETFIYGIETTQKETVYRIEADGLTIVNLAGFGGELTDQHIEKLEGVDILIVPVGGHDSLTGAQALKIINLLEPRIVIPINYQVPGLKTPSDELDIFCKEIAICPAEKLDKYKITKRDLPTEDMKVVLLTV